MAKSRTISKNGDCQRPRGKASLTNDIKTWEDYENLSKADRYTNEGRVSNPTLLNMEDERFKYKVDTFQLHRDIFRWHDHDLIIAQ